MDPAPARREAPRYAVSLGERRFDGSWGGLRDQTTVDFRWSIEPRTWFSGLEAGVSIGGQAGDVGGMRIDTDTIELYAGTTRTFPLPGERWFASAGAGISLADTGDSDEMTFLGETDDDQWAALYVRAGTYWILGRSWDLAVEARTALGSDLEILGDRRDGNYLLFTVGVGFSPPLSD